MTTGLLALLTLLAVAVTGVSATAAPPSGEKEMPLPDTPVGKQAQALLETLADGKPETIRRFAESHFNAGFLGLVPMDRHVEAIGGFANATGGLIPMRSLAATDTSLKLLG